MTSNKLKINSLLPEFNLPGTDGNIYSSKSFIDKKILIIIFSCNHCPYVQAYEQRIIDLQNEFKESGIQIVAISSNDAAKYP